MNYTVLEPIGARIADLPVGELEPEEVAQLRDVLAHHGVVVLPGQSVDDDTFTTFLRSFGELAFTQGETPVADHPELNVVSNVGRTTPPRSSFHVDTSYVHRPPAYSALRAVQIPERGGETWFTNQYRACETLPEAVRDSLQGRTITHVVTGVQLQEGDEVSAEHPVFRRHPLSGRTSLYLTTPSRCAAVSGMSDDEARETIAFLFEHSTRADNVLRHAWAPGDIVIWDNGCVLHRADHDGVIGDRVMHRGMVARYTGTTSTATLSDSVLPSV
jgi:taurine dioxygenase